MAINTFNSMIDTRIGNVAAKIGNVFISGNTSVRMEIATANLGIMIAASFKKVCLGDCDKDRENRK